MKSIYLFLFLLTASWTASAQPVQDQIIWQNKTRKFIIFLPQDYSIDDNMPLVINMHGFLTDHIFQMSYTRFNEVADTAGAVVVYPFGIGAQWNSGEFFPGLETGTDDVGFLSALIDYMAILYGIDTRRVYATGYSAGGFMSYRLACDIPNRIAAIAPVSASMNPDQLTQCNPDRPVPVNALNGTADGIVMYNGFFNSAPIDDVFALWRDLNGCDAAPIATPLPDIVPTDNTTTTRFDYTGCDNGSELVLHKIAGGGHTWPGRNFPLLGNTAQDIRANEVIWNFFKHHSIPDDMACNRPTGLSVENGEGTLTLSWDPVDGIDFYSLIYILPGEDLVFLESVEGHSYTFPSQADGDVVWLVRSQCVSGHASWSPITRSSIGGRVADSGGRVSVYPNPTADFATIDWSRGVVPQELVVVNALGHTVFRSVIRESHSRIDMTAWPEGVYHVIGRGAEIQTVTIRKL